jgi:hypothetical protein
MAQAINDIINSKFPNIAVTARRKGVSQGDAVPKVLYILEF